MTRSIMLRPVGRPCVDVTGYRSSDVGGCGVTQHAEGGAIGAGPVAEMPAHQLARRDRIIEAGFHALESQDYDQIQIRHVARSAGVALGTLYRYFSSKEHLYAAVLHLWVEGGRGRRHSGVNSTEARLRERVRWIIRSFELRPQFYKAYTLLLATADPNAKVIMTEVSATTMGSLAEDLAGLSDARARDVATMLWAIISTSLAQTIYHGRPMAEAYRLGDRFVDLVAAELVTPALGSSTPYPGRAAREWE